jgi:VIT1/CCC1 family predicted Fe2+/Mn2+ transporter
LLAAILVPVTWSVIAVYTTSLIFLVVLGAIGARTGGAPVFIGAVRVGFWGAIAMAVTAGIGTLFHVQL